MKRLFNFGDKVRSIRVGAMESFVGVVTFFYTNNRGDWIYHVRDDFGQYWHRSNGELGFDYEAKCRRKRTDGPTPCLCCAGECVG